MARFYGKVGYGETVESPPDSGVWVDQMTEISYFGDVIRNQSKSESGEGLNNNITLSNSISIIADRHAIDHYSKIRYVRWEGAVWSVTSVEVRSPRLILALGGVYNGPTF